MVEEIIMVAAVIGIFFLARYTRKKYVETKKSLLIFFLLFLTLIVAFTIDLVNHFSYIWLSILALIFILGVIDYYKRFKKIQLR